jgi:hypothetical protein
MSVPLVPRRLSVVATVNLPEANQGMKQVAIRKLPNASFQGRNPVPLNKQSGRWWPRHGRTSQSTPNPPEQCRPSDKQSKAVTGRCFQAFLRTQCRSFEQTIKGAECGLDTVAPSQSTSSLPQPSAGQTIKGTNLVLAYKTVASSPFTTCPGHSRVNTIKFWDPTQQTNWTEVVP